MTGALVLIAVGIVIGWQWRALLADVEADRAWWAARPHVAGVPCPPEAGCRECQP